MDRKGLYLDRQRLYSLIAMADCIFNARQLLPEQVPFQNALANRAKKAIRVVSTIWNLVCLTRSYKDVSQKRWQPFPINNTWMSWVEVHWGKCECLCAGHKRKVNTVYASPVVTPASASFPLVISGSRETPLQLDAGHGIINKKKSANLTLCHPQLGKCGGKNKQTTHCVC